MEGANNSFRDRMLNLLNVGPKFNDNLTQEEAPLFATIPEAKINNVPINPTRLLKRQEGANFVGIVDIPGRGKAVMKIDKELEGGIAPHEAFVGLFGTNQLTKLAPNFAIVYGYNEAISYPAGNKPHPAVYYEYVPGISLTKFFPVCGLSDLKAVLLQVILALAYANEAVGFVHYDLHGDNIRIATLSEPVDILFDGRVVCTSIYQPVMFDFGTSVIRVNGKVYSEKFDVNPNVAWIKDIYGMVSLDIEYGNDGIELMMPTFIREFKEDEALLSQGITSKVKFGRTINVAEDLAKMRDIIEDLTNRKDIAATPEFQQKVSLLDSIGNILFNRKRGVPKEKDLKITFSQFVDRALPLLQK